MHACMHACVQWNAMYMQWKRNGSAMEAQWKRNGNAMDNAMDNAPENAMQCVHVHVPDGGVVGSHTLADGGGEIRPFRLKR